MSRLQLPTAEDKNLSACLIKALRSMAAGATPAAAARTSGITVTEAYWDYLESRRFVKDLAGACGHRWETHLVPLALAALERALQPDAPLKQQIDAAKIVADRGGFAPRPYQETQDSKAITDMSREELYAFVKAGEARLAQAQDKLAELATPVNATETMVTVDQAVESIR